MKSRAFMLIKHEAIQTGHIGDIISRIEKKGLKLVALKMLVLSENDVRKLYDNCKECTYFEEIIKYNSNCPLIGIVVEGPNGNKCANEVCGKMGVMGSVRGDFALDSARNMLHCSDLEVTNQEIDMFFDKKEIYEYKLSNQDWLI